MKIDYGAELLRIFQCENEIDYDAVRNKEIVLYGAGSLGKLALQVLGKLSLQPLYIIDKKYTVGGYLDGIRVIPPSEIPEKDKKDKLFLICISTLPYNEISSYLKSLGIAYMMQFYTYAFIRGDGIMDNGWILDGTEENHVRAKAVCSMLEYDEESIAHYLQFLWWKVQNSEVVYKDFPVLSGKKYFASGLLPTLANDCSFLDLGAYHGGICGKFIEAVDGSYKKIWAVEPDRECFVILKKNLDRQGVECINCAIDNVEKGIQRFDNEIGMASKLSDAGNEVCEVMKVDDLNTTPNIVKIHIEGRELQALYSGIRTFRENRPAIMVMADHNKDGFYDIPMFIKNLEGYRLYFRLHDYCGNSAVWYFIPQ